MDSSCCWHSAAAAAVVVVPAVAVGALAVVGPELAAAVPVTVAARHCS